MVRSVFSESGATRRIRGFGKIEPKTGTADAFFAIPPVPQGVESTVSLHFDNATEGMVNSTTNALGIGNTWSYLCWCKLDNAADTTYNVLIRLLTSANAAHHLHVRQENDGKFLVELANTSSTIFKAYKWNNPWTSGVWLFVVVTWDGTNLKAYFNGTLTAPSSTPTDNSGSTSDESLKVFIGCFDTTPNHVWDGPIHSTALLNVVLTQAQITDLYNSGDGSTVDLRQAQGTYTSTEVAARKHYWRHGFNASSIGEDLGTASTLIDIAANAINMTAADIVSDAP